MSQSTLQQQVPFLFAFVSAALLTALALSTFVTACGDPLALPQPVQHQKLDAGDAAFGTLSLALQSEADGHTYQLTHAKFTIAGPDSKALTTDGQSTSEVLTAELQTGDYSITLEDGWQLLDEAGQAVSATVGNQRLAFRIEASGTSNVNFEFGVTLPSAKPQGTLNVSIAVSTHSAASVLITELMPDPSAHPDSSGEWIELTNYGSDAVELEGCVLARDTQTHSISGSHSVAAGAVFTLANGADPGFTPDYVYKSISLPNSAAFVLSLTCAGQLLDSVSISPDAWQVVAGKSLSYVSVTPSSTDNDNVEHWCAAATALGADFGTPGALNPACVQ